MVLLRLLLNVFEHVGANARTLIVFEDLAKDFGVWHIRRIVGLKALKLKLFFFGAALCRAGLVHGGARLLGLLVDFFAGHAIRQLLFVIFEDFFALLPL